MTWVKWWKNKDFCIILIAGFLSVILSALSVEFLPLKFPYNLILVLIICAIGGNVIRIKARRILDKLAKDWLKQHEKDLNVK
jgi:hypothetical protein